MLNEFILKQLDVIIKERDSLSRKLDELAGEENEENLTMRELLDREDVGVEVFSPRSIGKPMKLQVEDIKQRIEDIECQEALIRDQLEQTLVKEEKLRKMLSEAKIAVREDSEEDSEDAEVTQNQKLLQFQAETHEELQTILDRIDHCAEITLSDPEECRRELKTLQYYLKALLTKTETI